MPPDLTVRLGSVELKNPVVCASGEWTMTGDDLRRALDAGAAAVVAKSTNESEAAKRQLEKAEYALLDENWRSLERKRATGARTTTLLNRSGLVAEEFDAWVETLAQADAYAREREAYVVASLIPGDVAALAEMARAFENAGLRWLELNLSAAHAEEAPRGAIELVDDAEQAADVVARVRREISLPLAVKLPAQGDVLGLVAAALEAGADSVTLVGRPLAFLPDLETRRPILGTFGAIGGAWALPTTLRWVAKTRLRFGAAAPVIATNGLRDGRDVARALLAGATAAQLGTAVWLDGVGALARALAELGEYLEGLGLSASELVGEAADAAMTYEEVERRA